jgi:hypothetical protein
MDGAEGWRVEQRCARGWRRYSLGSEQLSAPRQSSAQAGRKQRSDVRDLKTEFLLAGVTFLVLSLPALSLSNGLKGSRDLAVSINFPIF